jgi:hypothetical protein
LLNTDKPCSEGRFLSEKATHQPKKNPNISSFHNRPDVDSFGRLKGIVATLQRSHVNLAGVDVIDAYLTVELDFGTVSAGMGISDTVMNLEEHGEINGK